MPYKHGTYGEIGDSRVTDVTQGNVVAAYIGTAPINLVRGYAEKELVNMPVKLESMSDAQTKLGYAADWESFSLCEAFAEHFDNSLGNIGPIYVVNVLDPETHRNVDATTKALTFKNNRTEFESSDIILDTFAIADKAEGVDYSLTYNFAKGTVVVNLLKDTEEDSLECTYNTVDVSAVEMTDIIGEETEDGQYTGLHAMSLLYQYHNAILNILAAPGWSHIPEIYKAMTNTVRKLNGHWDGFVNADIPLEDAEGEKIDTIAKAMAWAEENGYDSEYSKIYWPMVKYGDRVYHLSTVGSATMLRTDLANDGVPYESPSNKAIMATAQYFGEDSASRGFDQSKANSLNEKGITTACFWTGRWALWGPHTAAYKYNGDMDARAIFDATLRMLVYITNSFQIDHGTEIDAPMTPQDRDTILNAEKQKLDTLCGIGALIGTPTVKFIETKNPVNNMMNGEFVWDVCATTTPPFKSGTAHVCYTDDGFGAFFEGVE